MSANIKALRISKGMTQREFVKAIGLHFAYVSRLENDPQNLTLDILKKIATALDEEVGRLVSAKGFPSKNLKIKQFRQSALSFSLFANAGYRQLILLTNS